MSVLHWIPLAALGRLAIAPRPQGGDRLGDEMAAWSSAGVTHVVSLLETAEARDLELAHEVEACRAAGIGFTSHGIPDFGVPLSSEAFGDLVEDVARRVREGEHVVVHCHGGIGRSGLLTCSVLVATGLAPEEAMDVVGRARGVPVPQTDEQRAWLRGPR